MRVPLLDLGAQYEGIREELDGAVAGVVRSQQFVLGPEVEGLEDEIAASLGVEHAVGCASGTDAILLALRALELDPGAGVVVPTFTFFATAGAVWNAGLRPVFADIDPATYNVTRETIEAVLAPDVKAIVVVHLFGQMAPMAPILELAAERGLIVIEDAAQAIGARQHLEGEWRSAGAVGVAGCLSFFPTKNLGGFGDGGMVTVRDDAGIADRVRKLRVHGGRQMYHHEMVGTNSRLDAVQAAVLRRKLPHLMRWTRGRQERARRYDAAFAAVPGVGVPVVGPGNEHVYNQYTVRVGDRDAVRSRLDAAGIGSGVYYPVPLHLQVCFSELGHGVGDFEESELAAREVLSLPVYPEMTAGQQDAVIAAVTAAVTTDEE